MASLSTARVILGLPFVTTSVDYAGPFQVLRSKRRGMRSFKGYIALFICLSSKAIHMELVGDLTTQSFLGALTRFISRRGKPSEMWSDNGTNLAGTRNELKRLQEEAKFDWGCVINDLAQQGIRWKFIPPASPQFGGIWEAGIKSAKRHLKRVVGPRRLTYEEFSTLLADIEQVLNCRPLTPLTGGLDDLEVLTPGHLLVGRTLTSIPEPCAADVDSSHLSHWSLVKTLMVLFWTRWSREYLNTLQQRTK